MNLNKKNTGVRQMSQQLKQPAGQGHQVKPVIAQLKSVAPVPTAKVLQTKTVINRKSSAETRPTAPPAYRPQPQPRVLQTKQIAVKIAGHQYHDSKSPVGPARAGLAAQPKLRNGFHAGASGHSSNSLCGGCRSARDSASSVRPARALPIVVQLAAAKAKPKAKAEAAEVKIDICAEIRNLIALFGEETSSEKASKDHIAMHDRLLGAGKHHAKREVTYKQLIGDLQASYERRHCGE